MNSIKGDHQAHCACIIANLEGRFGFPPSAPFKWTPTSSIDELSQRLRAVEVRYGFKVALPTDTVTWHSLAWRISRLDRMLNEGGINAPRIMKPSAFSSLVGPEKECSLSTVANVVADLGTKWPEVQVPPIAKKIDDIDDLGDDTTAAEVTLDSLRQYLFYVAGKHAVRVDFFPVTEKDLFVLAVDISLHVEDIPGAPIPVPMRAGARPPPPGWGPPGVRRNMGAKKMCCGCCSCTCHNPRPKPFRISRRRNKGTSKVKAFFKFGWLKRLACWRRRGNVSDDSSSTTSSDSSTVID